MTALPVVDLEPFIDGSEADKQKVARQVGDACEHIGFLTIVGHHVPDDVIGDCASTAREFFDLDPEVKQRVAQPSPEHVRGYSAVGAEGLSYSLDEASPGDLKESFSIGPPDVPDDPYYTCAEAGPHFAPNLWPDRPRDMRPSWERYFDAMTDLAAVLMRVFAVALELPERFFDDKIDRHISMLRVLNYPDQAEPPVEGQLRAGAHSDYGSLTILRQDDAPGGLQVRDASGEWSDVPPLEGAFVVNIGDLMMQWTNDRWISTLHRVVNPPVDLARSSRRQSIVFFHQPNYDAVVASLDPHEPARYAPVTSGDHLLAKFVKQTTFGGVA